MVGFTIERYHTGIKFENSSSPTIRNCEVKNTRIPARVSTDNDINLIDITLSNNGQSAIELSGGNIGMEDFSVTENGI